MIPVTITEWLAFPYLFGNPDPYSTLLDAAELLSD
jgi:hypothetical protein